ncbi:MAG TPA: hypothetical protein VF814_00405 [Casimicrobiaceae bacterium]
MTQYNARGYRLTDDGFIDPAFAIARLVSEHLVPHDRPPPVAPKPTGAPDELLRTILAEVRALRSEVAAALSGRRAGPTLSDHDRARLGALLPAVFAALGDRVWSAAVLLHVAATDDSVAEALAPFLATPGGLRGLGKLLRRAEGQGVGDFVVARVGDGRGSALWQVRKAQESRDSHSATGERPPHSAS